MMIFDGSSAAIMFVLCISLCEAQSAKVFSKVPAPLSGLSKENICNLE